MSNRRLYPIRCDCPECGREWSIEEIRAHPACPPGQSINKLTLSKVGRLLGHAFYYADGVAKGTWANAAPAAPPPVPAETPWSSWRFGSDPDVMELGPINPPFHNQPADGPEVGGVK